MNIHMIDQNSISRSNDNKYVSQPPKQYSINPANIGENCVMTLHLENIPERIEYREDHKLIRSGVRPGRRFDPLSIRLRGETR